MQMQLGAARTANCDPSLRTARRNDAVDPRRTSLHHRRDGPANRIRRESSIWAHWLRFMSERHTLVRYDPRGCGLSQTDVDTITFDDCDPPPRARHSPDFVRAARDWLERTFERVRNAVAVDGAAGTRWMGRVQHGVPIDVRKSLPAAIAAGDAAVVRGAATQERQQAGRRPLHPPARRTQYVLATADPDSAAAAMLGKSTWAVIALTCFVEIFTQAHYLHSIRDDGQLSPLFKDVFYYHWVEEVQHATTRQYERRSGRRGSHGPDRARADDRPHLAGASVG